MKTHLIFIGNKFTYNPPLKEYILRTLEAELAFIDMISFLKDTDTSLFLYLEEALNAASKVVIVTTKQNFSTIGKVICTATNDNQILRDGMLIPQKVSLFEERSYLLEYKGSFVNVLQIDEGEKMPEILLHNSEIKAVAHIFEEERETLVNILTPIAQTYEVHFDFVQKVEGWLRLDIYSKKYGDITKFMEASKKLLPKKFIASSNIIEYIIDKLYHSGKKVSFAESCTGGLLAYYFTKQNGASKILEGSLVTYSNALKENWLAVDHTILEENGAVSAAVVEEMSDGALNVSDADYALAISGIAGDAGGTDEKPVGTVYIGVRSQTQHIEKHLHFFGDRNYVQHQSALMAIKMLLLLDKETFF
ncbi:CinA family protein [Sulfurimonas sp.]|uniref:CinA family protein n=1 Tax=Sulfurimonas sp. TaxID=2022749 RepID=UPI002607AB95|nr:CinA family protein [Sulfurimonas sp.]